ncbi:MAG TPA: NAD(P)/FAD-dependent oxidoreductase [Dehalococcoidia bacterium]|nr:NAD(P)/FAD-dependent oxidoreductase [Dehalococcoidia bacterium]
MKSDVVIVGAGMAGLATGALLSKQGKRVTVLEKGNVAGGRAYCYEEKGFTLNYGAHAMYIPLSGPLAELMGRLGRSVPECGYPEAMRSYWVHGDRFAAMGAKPHQVLTTKLFSIGGRMALAKIMLAVRGEKTDRLPAELTWGEWIDAKTGDRAVREFMLAFGTVNSYTNPSADLSAAFFIGHLQRTLFAKDLVGYMFGGWRAMYDQWIEDIEAGGGTIVTGERVDVLETSEGRIVAAVGGGTRHEADAFVCTLPPQDAPSIAPEGSDLRAEMLRWSTLDAVRAYCIDLGLSRPLRDDDATFVFDVQRTLYYSIHSESAPDLAPAGGQLLHAMAYLTPDEARDAALRESRGDELRAGLDRHFPGWKEAATVERTMPDAKVLGARRTPANIKNLVPLRASSVENLYFAGDSRDVPHNLTLGCLVSAMEVADAIETVPVLPETKAEAAAM